MKKPDSFAEDILLAIFAQAKTAGLSRLDVLSRAGIQSPAVSRAIRTGDCRLSTILRIAKAANVRIAVVPDDSLAEKLLKGEVF